MKILIVEDEAELRHEIANYLQNDGLLAEQAAQGQWARPAGRA